MRPEFDISELTTYVDDALRFAPSMLLTAGGHAVWHLDTGEFECGRGQFVSESVELNVPPRMAS